VLIYNYNLCSPISDGAIHFNPCHSTQTPFVFSTLSKDDRIQAVQLLPAIGPIIYLTNSAIGPMEYAEKCLVLQYPGKEPGNSSGHPLRWGSHDDRYSWGGLSRGQRWRSRADVLTGSAGHFNIRAIIALLALDLTIVFVLFATLARGRLFRDSFRFGLRRCCPAVDLPGDAGEALKLEAAFLPLTTWLPRAIEGPQTSIDCTLVGLRTELVGRCSCI
jgi:hypothetical protein